MGVLRWLLYIDSLIERVCRRLGIDEVKVSYFGNGVPEPDAKTRHLFLPGVGCCQGGLASTDSVSDGDVVAVSVTNLHGVYQRVPGGSSSPIRVRLDGVERSVPVVEFFAELDRTYRPIGRAGYSILLYRLSPEHRID